MLLLRFIELAITLSVAWLVITQLLMPLIFGLKFLPMFRNTELKQKVDAARDEVADLKDQTVQLTELELLLKQKHDLEEKIASISKPEVTTSHDGMK